MRDQHLFCRTAFRRLNLWRSSLWGTLTLLLSTLSGLTAPWISADFTTGVLPTGATLYGTTALSNNVLALTPDLGGMNGGIVFADVKPS